MALLNAVRQFCNLSVQVSLQVSIKNKERYKMVSPSCMDLKTNLNAKAGLHDCNLAESTALQVGGLGRDRKSGKTSATK